MLWARGRRWRRRRRRRRRSWAGRRQRPRPGWGDGAGARGPRGAARLRGAWSGVRSAAASLPGAGGREDAEQVDERQQQEPGARVQLHRAAAGRQRVHLHHPGQCRAALSAGPPRPRASLTWPAAAARGRRRPRCFVRPWLRLTAPVQSASARDPVRGGVPSARRSCGESPSVPDPQLPSCPLPG